MTMPETTFTTIERIDELSKLLASPSHPAKDVRILRDGEEAFSAMLEGIAAARDRVRFENFIFAGDATGKHFAEALRAAAGRGVDVRVLYDPVGTMMVRGGSIARSLRGSDVDARPFRPLSPYAPWTWTRLRHRDHRKTLCIDGRHAFVGGLCISDNWSPSSRGGSGWRDTALRVGGGVVADLERAFEAMWKGAASAIDATSSESDRDLAPPAVMVAADQPGEPRVGALYTRLAEVALRSIDITDAYLVVPARALQALIDAARRGVSVRLLLPGHNNHPLAGAAARRNYAMLLDAGVEIWEWKGAMVHAKTAVVDEAVSLVGSSNLDPLSMRRNYELNLLVVDPATGQGMQAMFDRDLENAKRIELDAWKCRPRWRRIAERGARLFAPDL